MAAQTVRMNGRKRKGDWMKSRQNPANCQKSSWRKRNEIKGISERRAATTPRQAEETGRAVKKGDDLQEDRSKVDRQIQTEEHKAGTTKTEQKQCNSRVS